MDRKSTFYTSFVVETTFDAQTNATDVSQRGIPLGHTMREGVQRGCAENLSHVSFKQVANSMSGTAERKYGPSGIATHVIHANVVT